ncbi:MAG: hypothetical protein KBE91_11425, partial [Bacteroidia bacterium]|nr:hypothetical protein [Bacteroidia bacterium]
MNSETIIDNYGYVLIPKGTFLYRGVKKNITKDYMFFTTKFCDAKSFGSLIQVWKTKIEIKLPFFILYLNHQAKGISSIPEVYNELFPHDANPKYRDLDIKMNSKREDFIKKLSEINIDGWFSSIEDNTQVEACIFNSEKFVELVRCQTDVEIYIYDSLRKIKIIPSQRFFNLTSEKLSNNNV